MIGRLWLSTSSAAGDWKARLTCLNSGKCCSGVGDEWCLPDLIRKGIGTLVELGCASSDAAAVLALCLHGGTCCRKECFTREVWKTRWQWYRSLWCRHYRHSAAACFLWPKFQNSSTILQSVNMEVCYLTEPLPSNSWLSSPPLFPPSKDANATLLRFPNSIFCFSFNCSFGLFNKAGSASTTESELLC